MTKKFNLSRVFKTRDKLFQAITPYVDLHIVGNTVHDLADDLYRICPPDVSHDALFESCRVIAGTPLTRRSAAEFAWSLAGNMALLRSGTPIVPWTRQIRDECVPVQVTHVDPDFRRGTSGQLLRVRALAGSYCPGIFEQFLSRGSCTALARTIGFSRSLPYTNSLYFTNLRFLAHIDAAKSGNHPQFKLFDCTASMKAYNRRIIAIRLRRKPCPKNFEHMCEQCHIGANNCKAGIFQLGLTARYCSACNQIRQFDVTRSEEMCFACWRGKKATHQAGA